MNAPLRFVLDTNVVIDWLVFAHPFLDRFRELVASRRIAVLTNELARDELVRVLEYPILKLEGERRAEVLARYDAQCVPVNMPDGFSSAALSLPPGFPHCRDRDDDAFLALAFHARASALVTRDNALLKLKKRVRRYGVSIIDVPQMMELVGE